MKSGVGSPKGGYFAAGGNKKMFGKMGVTPADPGVSVHPTAPSPAKGPAKGGKAYGSKQGGAVPAQPGKVTPGGNAGNNSFKASGGSGRMFGPQSAARAQPGTSSKANG
jgi:hypothetical protein